MNQGKNDTFLLCEDDFCKHLEVLLNHCSELNPEFYPEILCYHSLNLSKPQLIWNN
jgi:hypothetical protein